MRNLYFSEFSIKKIGYYLILLTLFFSLRDIINTLLKSLIVDPVISKIPRHDLLVSAFVCLVCIKSIQSIRKVYSKKMYPSPNSLLLAVCALILYFYYRTSGIFEFYDFKMISIPYLDFLIPSILILTLQFKSYKIPLKKPLSEYTLLDDNFSNKDSDLMYYSDYSFEVSKYIASTTSENSIGIAIIGQWGSGKTFFIQKLKSKLDVEENIIFDFNPWRISNTQSIVDEFFKTLSINLRPYNRSIASKISDYSKRILQPGKEIQYRLIDVLLHEWLGEEDLQKKYDSINSAIQSTGKRLIIFIDDVDRLAAKEIVEVLRIIRNTGNFGNTFFVVTFDMEYVVSSLSNDKSYAKEENYLKKVFQLMITLPIFEKDIYKKEMKKYLLSEKISDQYNEEIEGALEQLCYSEDDAINKYYPGLPKEGLVEELIDNLRDLKRFCNSFKITYNILKDDVDVHDLIVLELLRNKDMEVYNLIRSRKLFVFDSNKPTQLMLEQSQMNILEEKYKSALKEFGGVKAAIEYLFSDEGYKNERKFLNIINFHLYFSYQLRGLVPLKEFNELIEKKEWRDIIIQFDKWMKDEKEQDLLRVLAIHNTFRSSALLEKIILVYMNMGGYQITWLQYAFDALFNNRASNQVNLFSNDLRDHQNFIKRIMDNKDIRPEKRAFLANPFLESIVRPDIFPHNEGGETLQLLEKNEWNDIIAKLFAEYLASLISVSVETLQFLYYNVDKVKSNGQVELYKPSCDAFREYLFQNRKLFSDYTNLIFRPAITPYDGSVKFEPFFLQIFGNWQYYKEHLEKTEIEDMKLKEIILANIELYFSIKTVPFQFGDDSDKKYVEKIMKKNGMMSLIDIANLN